MAQNGKQIRESRERPWNRSPRERERERVDRRFAPRGTDDYRQDPLRGALLQKPSGSVEYYRDRSALTGIALLGDARRALEALNDRSVQCVVTSPPYWSLRDYGIEGQIGLTESMYSYIDELADVFSQVRRVLRDDGTLWLNIGDSYTSGNRGWRAPDKKNPARAMSKRPRTPEGLKEKELIGLPWRLAFALQRSGWYLRSEIIWQKPNAQPESVRDRVTREHEQLFLLSKSPKYKYNVDAVKGPNGRRLRDVWSINTRPNPYARGHFATFPDELVERCLTIATTDGDVVLDPFLGSGTTAAVAAKLGRRFIGIELNPDYVDLATDRLRHLGLSAERGTI